MSGPPHASPRDLKAEELAELDALIDGPEDDAPTAADALASAVPPVASNSATGAINLATARAKARVVLACIDHPMLGQEQRALELSEEASFRQLIEAREKALSRR